ACGRGLERGQPMPSLRLFAPAAWDVAGFSPSAPSLRPRPLLQAPFPCFPVNGATPMLDDNLKTQLKAYLEKLVQPIELVASLDDGDKSRELDTLLQDIASMSDKISLRRDDSADARKPSFAINRLGTDVSVSFAAIPMGHEFTSLVLALL